MLTDSGSGYGYGFGDGYGFGYGYGYGSRSGSGSGYGDGYGYGLGDGDGYGHVPVGDPISMVAGEYPVTAVTVPGYFLVGCKGPYTARHWETHWREYAEQEDLDISEQEAEEALEAMRLHAH